MQYIRLSAFLLLTIMFFCPAGPLQACPLCKEAISSPGTDDEEINNLPAAYNTSIYMMVGVPYLLLGGMSYFIYCGCRRNAAFLESQSSASPVRDPTA
jgi:hypothetical protein